MKVVVKQIEVVAWFDKSGKIHPVRFRIENDDNTFETIVIGRVLKIDLEKLTGNYIQVFTCQSSIDGIEKIYEIKFELKSSRWSIHSY
ncbi:hypothetical protein [Clostridium tagluense]|uniref:hypothetical protein n=1 Tax=Clostridium tagluense TaxID=360422 RepID=UPI001C6E89D0|nr:hypothetical protein [Clostridium tagluense]MBW9156543.1 hypothetical protein [Clostridium tagluense]WLC64717.1 hypothetical protein KTC93_17955 [Clostridium tagluense]